MIATNQTPWAVWYLGDRRPDEDDVMGSQLDRDRNGRTR